MKSHLKYWPITTQHADGGLSSYTSLLKKRIVYRTSGSDKMRMNFVISQFLFLEFLFAETLTDFRLFIIHRFNGRLMIKGRKCISCNITLGKKVNVTYGISVLYPN